MGSEEQVCYTFEAAIEKAIEMERDGFRHYRDAMNKVKDRAAKLILKDAALDELEHKHQLERALVEGSFAGEGGLERPVPTMNLDYTLKTKELSPDADAREALAYAIHLEKESLDFYKRMNQGCAGAPMAALFEKMGNDESRHLKALEDLYEEHFMTEN